MAPNVVKTHRAYVLSSLTLLAHFAVIVTADTTITAAPSSSLYPYHSRVRRQKSNAPCGYNDGDFQQPLVPDKNDACYHDDIGSLWDICTKASPINKCYYIGRCYDKDMCTSGCGIGVTLTDLDLQTIMCSGVNPYCAADKLIKSSKTYTRLLCWKNTSVNTYYDKATNSPSSMPPSVSIVTKILTAQSSAVNRTEELQEHKSTNIGAIVGGVIGGLVLLFAAAVAALIARKRSVRKNKIDGPTSRSYEAVAAHDQDGADGSPHDPNDIKKAGFSDPYVAGAAEYPRDEKRLHPESGNRLSELPGDIAPGVASPSSTAPTELPATTEVQELPGSTPINSPTTAPAELVGSTPIVSPLLESAEPARPTSAAPSQHSTTGAVSSTPLSSSKPTQED